MTIGVRTVGGPTLFSCISICGELWISHRTPRLRGCLTLGVHFILELTSLKEPLTELVLAQRCSLGFIWKTVEREIFEKMLNLCWRFPFTGFCLPLLGISSSFQFICEGDMFPLLALLLRIHEPKQLTYFT